MAFFRRLRERLVGLVERATDSALDGWEAGHPDEGWPGSWSDPDNDDPVPRELRWTVRDETNYGSEHQTIRGLEAENARAGPGIPSVARSNVTDEKDREFKARVEALDARLDEAPAPADIDRS